MIEIVFDEKKINARMNSSEEIKASPTENGAIVLIQCSNGMRKVSKSILNISDHYRRVMESKIRFEDFNPLDLSDFSMNTVSKYISILRGVGTIKISIYELNELLHLLDYDGKLEISKFELKIFESIRNSLLAYNLNSGQIEKLRKVIQLEKDLILELLNDMVLKQKLDYFFTADILFRLSFWQKAKHIENSTHGQPLKDLRNSVWNNMFDNMQILFSETKYFSRNCGHMNPWPEVEFEENFRISLDFQVTKGFGGVISLCGPRNSLNKF